MAETVLRFGPEWLRALTDGGVSHQSSSVNPVSSHQNTQSSANTITTDSSSSILPSNKYKLAQYRYGREEMLALFDNDIEMAPELREIPTLTVDKCQLPLALIPITEEEHRLWSKSVNSEAMLRLNKMNATGSSTERDRTERTAAVSSVNNERTTGPPMRTIRGGMTTERVRGRGRSAYYQRTGTFDENGETGEPREAFRKNYEKSTSVSEDGPREKSFDRSLSRGESSDEGNRNRKDVRLADNWRSGGRNDDRNNWRARGRTDDNWQRTHDSWRTDDRDGLGDDNHRNGPIMRRGYGNHYKRNSEGWDDVDDEERRGNLPEWSLDDDMSCEARVGTFDASGAFREGTMDDDLKDISSGHNSKENSVKKNTVDQNSSLSSDSVNMDKNESSQNDSKLKSNLDEDRISTHSYEESKVMIAPPISNLPDNNIDSQFQLQSQLSSQTHQPSLLPQIQNQLQNQQISSQLHSSLQPPLQSQLQAQPQQQFQSQLQPQLQSQLQSLAQSQLQPQLQQLQSQLQPQLQQQLQSQLQSQLQPQLQPQLTSQLLHQHQTQSLSQQQPQSQHNTQHHLQSLLENSHINHKPHPEEDGLSHLEKAAENMVAQWTAEADQEERVMRDKQSNKMTVVPLHHDDAYKWFYRDPQGEIQGPFLPQEMYEWSCSGYFTLDLLVRRGCDERFSQLGELIKAWGRMPFISNKNPPPVVSITPQTQPIKPINADAIPSALSPNSLYSQNPFRQQQIIQQRQQDQIQRQLFLNQQLQMQTQLRQLLDQLKKQDGFSTLSAQEQQCVLVQQYVTSQHQADQRRMQPTPPQPTNIPDEPKSVMEQLSRLGVPVVRSGPLLTQSTSSIWDLNGGVITASALEELQRRERDKLELEEKKKLLEKEQHEAQKRAALEAQRKREEEMRIEELTRKLEHEKKLREELLRDQEERRRREEEEEKRRLDQERMELEREKKRLEEERRRHEEMLRVEELARKQREEERQRRQKEAEENERILRQEQMQQEMAQSRKSKQLSQQKQNQPALQKQLQAQQNQQVKERKENQKQVQNQQAHSQKESKRIWPDLAKSEKNDGWSYNSDSPSPDPNTVSSVEFPSQNQLWKSDNLSSEKHIWGQACSKNSTTISLAEIQRLQEAKEREEKIKLAQAQTERQNIYLEKQSNAQQLFEQHQKQQMKNQLTWARSHLQQTQAPVKTLAEIQREEAQKLEKQKKVEEKKTVKQNTVTNAGIWSNAASQLSWKGSSTNAWNQSSVNTGSSNQTSSSSGPNFTSNMGEAFWETPAVKESKTNASKQQKNSALQHSNKSSGGNNSGCSGKSKSRKEEEAVRQVFSNQRRQKADEFTQWCTEALSKYKSSIDIPTFVAFLKDVESPFDVNDYVNSYLGDTKETKDFANQFLEKRSFFRNQAKKEASEELMWGPAPAITPSVNKSSHNNPSSNNGGEGNSGAASKKKKKKAKKVANSILGFTVQSDPDRINAGEIETMDK